MKIKIKTIADRLLEEGLKNRTPNDKPKKKALKPKPSKDKGRKPGGRGK